MVSRSLKGSKRSTAIHLLVDQEPTTLAGSQSLCDTQVSTRGRRVPVLIHLIFTPCRVASVTAQDRDKGCGTGGVGQFDSRALRCDVPALGPGQRGENGRKHRPGRVEHQAVGGVGLHVGGRGTRYPSSSPVLPTRGASPTK